MTDERFQSAHAELALGRVSLADIRLTGKGTCAGGKHPHPPLHDYPLLAWTHLGHHQHGKSVFTEDQKASVSDIATALVETPDFAAIAARFGTTEDHVRQAVGYAIRAGMLG